MMYRTLQGASEENGVCRCNDKILTRDFIWQSRGGVGRENKHQHRLTPGPTPDRDDEASDVTCV